MAVKSLPRKKAIPEIALVEDMAETVAPHGYKVTRHRVTHDHERDETKLDVSFVRANPDHGVLKLAKNGEGGDDV